MIRVLAQIVSRQVCIPKEVRLDEPDPPPPRSSMVEQTPYVPRVGPCLKASSPGVQATEAVETNTWLEPPDQPLVVLFTELAQRCVQAARAQEETHEYRSHHHGSPRADGVRLRAAIHSLASE